jgi:Zn-dependent protease
MLASEWAHNLSHLAAAHKLGKPMDELHIILGMPRCIYFNLDDTDVAPLEHIQRSIAGPLLNAAVLPLLVRLRQGCDPGSMACELWDAAIGMNIFLATVSLLPIPGIDGGPMLKWGLVERGYLPGQADETVRRVNGLLALILGAGALLAKARKKHFLSLLLGALASTALGVFFGWIKETEILQSSNIRKEI